MAVSRRLKCLGSAVIFSVPETHLATIVYRKDTGGLDRWSGPPVC